MKDVPHPATTILQVQDVFDANDMPRDELLRDHFKQEGNLRFNNVPLCCIWGCAAFGVLPLVCCIWGCAAFRGVLPLLLCFVFFF